MKNLEALTRDQASEASQQIFDAVKSQLGMVPNVFATLGNSSKALQATLGIGDTLKGGEYSGAEAEAIALAVAQANTCDYCLAAHTAVGKMQGLSLDETIAIRNGSIADNKLKALSDLSKAITETRGFPKQELVDAFFNAGYSKAALAELIVHIAYNTVTNYTNHIAGTTIDFPAAPQLQEA